MFDGVQFSLFKLFKNPGISDLPYFKADYVMMVQWMFWFFCHAPFCL